MAQGALKIHFDQVHTLTGVATGPVTAGQALTVDGGLKGRNPKVKVAEAGGAVLGFAGYDAAADEVVPVVRVGVVELLCQATGAIAAGDQVKVGTGGLITKAGSGDTVVGVALTAAAATKSEPVTVLLTL